MGYNLFCLLFIDIMLNINEPFLSKNIGLNFDKFERSYSARRVFCVIRKIGPNKSSGYETFSALQKKRVPSNKMPMVYIGNSNYSPEDITLN